MYDSDLDDSAESSDDEEDDGKSTSGDEWVVLLLTDSQLELRSTYITFLLEIIFLKHRSIYRLFSLHILARLN
jgi:hypothetical protein